MEIFYILLVLLIVSRIFAEIAVRLGQPELLGEIVAGILLGLVVHHNQGYFPILAEHHHWCFISAGARLQDRTGCFSRGRPQRYNSTGRYQSAYEINLLESKVGRVIVSAAVIDDVLSLLFLAVLTAVIKSGSIPGGFELARLVFNIMLFFILTSMIDYFVFPWLGKLLQKSSADEFELGMLLTTAFSYALLAELLGMHFILGV